MALENLLALFVLASHVGGDFLTQNDQEARTKFSSVAVRALHVTKYTLWFFWVLWFLPLVGAAGLLLLIWVTHFITDTRRWVPENHPWPAKAIVVDQSIHLVTLAVLFWLATLFTGGF